MQRRRIGDTEFDDQMIPVGESVTYTAGPTTGKRESPSPEVKKPQRTFQQVCGIPDDVDTKGKR